MGCVKFTDVTNKLFMRMVKLTIERDTSEKSNKEVLDNEIAIPYPTYFHPSSHADIQSLVQWASESSQRVVLVSNACVCSAMYKIIICPS